VSPPKTTINNPAISERMTMPFEYTSRSPRFASCRGMYPSPAMIDDTRGKSANAVFAARIRMAKVENCSM
jgi:hypothetical protein